MKKKNEIKIKPSKVGSFTEWCKRHGFKGVNCSCIKAGLRSRFESIRKKALFAKNFGHKNCK
jgi:hypothetical protein